MSYSAGFLEEVARIATHLAPAQIEELVWQLHALRLRSGRLFVLGIGGSSANASHMAADLRKLCEVDARSLDSMAELTARANDEGWETIFDGLLAGIGKTDAIFVLSVGGGTREVSAAIPRAIDLAKAEGARVFGIVGPHGGATTERGDCVVKIPALRDPTPYTEAYQAVIWHSIVTHPLLQRKPAKWR